MILRQRDWFCSRSFPQFVAAFLAKNGAWWGIAIFQCAAGILAEVS
jgi:hypothetical protein